MPATPSSLGDGQRATAYVIGGLGVVGTRIALVVLTLMTFALICAVDYLVVHYRRGR